MADDEIIEEARSGRSGLILSAIVAVVLVVFMVQNTAETEVTWLLFDASGPLWIVIIVAAVAGALLSEVLGWMVRRARRR